jgi:hypothetical protein
MIAASIVLYLGVGIITAITLWRHRRWRNVRIRCLIKCGMHGVSAFRASRFANPWLFSSFGPCPKKAPRLPIFVANDLPRRPTLV